MFNKFTDLNLIHYKALNEHFQEIYGKDKEYNFDEYELGCPECKYKLDNWEYLILPALVNRADEFVKKQLEGFFFRTKTFYVYCVYPKCINYKKIFWIVKPNEDEIEKLKLLIDIQEMKGTPIFAKRKELIDYSYEMYKLKEKERLKQEKIKLIDNILENGRWITKRKSYINYHCENCSKQINQYDIVFYIKDGNSLFLCENCSKQKINESYRHLKKLQVKRKNE